MLKSNRKDVTEPIIPAASVVAPGFDVHIVPDLPAKLVREASKGVAVLMQDMKKTQKHSKKDQKGQRGKDVMVSIDSSISS
ncbi:hypothetical protein V6N13_142580 [Hibiscus sabdariffa]